MNIDIENQLNIGITDLVAQRCAVLGASGSGKSNTVAVLVEEVAAHMPFIILDPHSEYWGLRQKLNILIVGRSENVDVPIDAEQAPAIAEYVYQNSLSVILDLLLLDEDERIAFVLAFFGRLWELGIRHKKTFGIILEEAHNFIPEGVKSSAVKKLMTRFALEGRKFGFGMILSTQTTVEISKTVLRQVGLLFLHRVYHTSDIKIYQQIIPDMEPEAVKRTVHSMERGQAIVVIDGERQIVNIRKRHTFHVGATPELGDEPPPLRAIDEALLAELRQVVQVEAQSKPVKLQTGRHDDSELRRTIAELEQAVAERDHRIAELEQQLEAQRAMVVVSEPILQPIEDDLFALSNRESERQQQAFTRLLDKINTLPFNLKTILHYLLKREGKKFALKELARVNGYSESAIQSRFVPLLEMGLMGSQDGVYWTTARELVRRDFPDLDEADLMGQLLARTQ